MVKKLIKKISLKLFNKNNFDEGTIDKLILSKDKIIINKPIAKYLNLVNKTKKPFSSINQFKLFINRKDLTFNRNIYSEEINVIFDEIITKIFNKNINMMNKGIKCNLSYPLSLNKSFEIVTITKDKDFIILNIKIFIDVEEKKNPYIEKINDEIIIKGNNVSKFYVNDSEITKVLDNISFEIKKGEYVAIYGKSGSGKSTLLNLISGLDRPTAGSIINNGVNIETLSDSKLTWFRRNNISFIFQSYYLLENLSAYDNVLSGSYLQKDKEKVLDIDKLFSEYDIDNIKYKFPATMSGGQQQRVSILRALIKNSPVIIADEPTGALDPETTKIVLTSLDKMNKEYNTTIIMVTHDEPISRLANKIIYIEEGKIAEIKINNNPATIEQLGYSK
ncbi:ABC transporter ATP-binding protein [Mycoplasma phocimorsus]|uniref:ABC transporter ATP-binding protein n=1 Tax=Mycoplasma phocimorsus TaxID=3045839 RepID=A0AAJ1PSN3_9MOLU|nr:ABC transporter ATP-binding protein [Mycoplasma phocimorsus]MDJ1645487.1 ABC transporter ATP-binding protein [Mycoplasma phocimorsus]MDJ1646203.1 ABC transporter ATP-binding protein [Mycoplasma phocimorsus]MDJ1646801.1 ABC transporter ATP-binding protein [Mycoplasma phocimorsus]MDJ1647775.1 ABC transporter ATP-binding protein [Mycoplasma phocimorsus]MDJ1648186.1 ABC transporter ATP-binding protein [Mycoplasma phocimorsus]